MNVLLSLFGYRHHTYLVIIVKRKQSFEKEKSCRGNLTQILVLTTVWVYLPALARPRSPLVEGDEGLHLSNFPTSLVYVFHSLSLLFWPFINAKASYHLGYYDTSLLGT